MFVCTVCKFRAHWDLGTVAKVRLLDGSSDSHYDANHCWRVATRTIDGVQGQEDDLIILDSVGSKV
jgi:hypothetical protein